jgi:hypothetical protein
MKTALQEFIDNVIPMHIIELDMIKQEINKALEKEKEQIIYDYMNGKYYHQYEDITAEDYYNQTYNKPIL